MVLLNCSEPISGENDQLQDIRLHSSSLLYSFHSSKALTL